MSGIISLEHEMLEIIHDPVQWGEQNLGVSPSWYQEQIIRQSHHREGLRYGECVGTCIEENQRIINPNTGEYKSIGELYQSQLDGITTPLLTLNEFYQLKNSKAFPLKITVFKIRSLL